MPQKRSPVLYLREVLLEGHAVEEGLLGLGRVDGEHVLRVVHHLVRHHALRVSLEAVDPAVAHAVAELLLLAVQDVLRAGEEEGGAGGRTRDRGGWGGGSGEAEELYSVSDLWSLPHTTAAHIRSTHSRWGCVLACCLLRDA